MQTTKHSSPVSWAGVPKMWVSVCQKQPYWFLNHSKHLHCLCQANSIIPLIKDRVIQPQEDITQDPDLCRWTQSMCFKGGKAVTSIILGESETHTSHHEPLLVTSPKIQTQHNSLLYFLLLVSRGFLSSWGCESSSKTKEGQDMRLSWGRVWWVEDWELGKQRNEKQQCPIVERKELYSIFSDKSHEKG